MAAFRLSERPLLPGEYAAQLADTACGGFATFEGWVRDHNDGRRVAGLEYEAYAPLALAEGERIVAEALERFGAGRVACVHRIGTLGVGELAVWVGAAAAHRAAAFAACRYVIDQVKRRVPIWKKEHYADGDSGWVNCEACTGPHPAQGPTSPAEPGEVQSPHPAHGLAAPDYSRQVVLPGVGPAGQERLGRSSVLVVGAGGLGAPVLQYLAAAGVGRIAVVDDDLVEASNLHRQPLYGPGDVGQPKAAVAARRLREQNPRVDVVAHACRATAGNLPQWLADCDVVVDCTDNFAAKFLVSDSAVRLGRPAVFASVHQYEGQLQVYRPRANWPCLRCLWPDAPRDGLVGNCAQAGVLGPVPGALGAMQAAETLKLLLGLGDESPPQVHLIDLLDMRFSAVRAVRRVDCNHDATDRPAAQDDEPSEPLELWFDTLADAQATGLTLVDIREHWERLQDEPAPAIELHVPMSDLIEGRAELPREGRYLVVCAHGVRSLAIAGQLREIGVREAYSLAGGLAAVTA